MDKKKKLIVSFASVPLLAAAFVVYVYSASPIGQSQAVKAIPTPGDPTSIIINFSDCSRGGSLTYFTLGSTSFRFFGIHGEKCKFTFSSEMEMSGYGRATTCNVPTSLGQREFAIADDGIQWGSTLSPYCK